METQAHIPQTDELAVVGDPQACLIAGSWGEGRSQAAISHSDPTTDRLLASFPGASPEQASSAARAARVAMDAGPWSELGGAQRGAILHRYCDLLEARSDELARLLVAELGSPVRLARSLHVAGGIDCLRWFADAAARGPRGGYEEMLRLHEQPILSGSMLRREPVGVVAGITAYNYPLILLARKLGGALAAGCTTVIMPSPRVSLFTIAAFRILDEVDLPPGVANLVVGDADVGAELTTSPEVDLVTFTGSRSVGAAVMAQAASSVKRVVLEMGGKSPNIVLPGTDVSAAVGPSSLRFAINTGQACGATTRTLVPRADYEGWVAETQKFLDKLSIGDPRLEESDVGPLIDAEHRARVQGYVDSALEAGGTVEARAKAPDISPSFIDVSLIGNVDNLAEISQRELFGPVGVVMPFDTLEEALSVAHATPYALNANVWGPLPDAIAFARRVRSGTVTVNGGAGMRQDVPWGGGGQSGIGREGGEEGFSEFFEVKHIQWPFAGTTKPFGAE